MGKTPPDPVERAHTAAIELREVTREAHEHLQDLQVAINEMKHEIDNIAEKSLNRHFQSALLKTSEEMGRWLKQGLDALRQHLDACFTEINHVVRQIELPTDGPSVIIVKEEDFAQVIAVLRKTSFYEISGERPTWPDMLAAPIRERSIHD